MLWDCHVAFINACNRMYVCLKRVVHTCTFNTHYIFVYTLMHGSKFPRVSPGRFQGNGDVHRLHQQCDSAHRSDASGLQSLAAGPLAGRDRN